MPELLPELLGPVNSCHIEIYLIKIIKVIKRQIDLRYLLSLK